MIVSEKAFNAAKSRGKRATKTINGNKRSGFVSGTNFYFLAGPTRQKVSLTGKNKTTNKTKTKARKNPCTTKKTNKKKLRKMYEPGAVYLLKRNPRGYNVYLANARGTGRNKQGYVMSKADARKWLKKNGFKQAILV